MAHKLQSLWNDYELWETVKEIEANQDHCPDCDGLDFDVEYNRDWKGFSVTCKNCNELVNEVDWS